jgi:c-di-GMP-binding flagellar brake protein YcgR
MAPTVLVADAEIYICRVFEAKLSRNQQFQVTIATSSHEAFHAALLTSFDVILWEANLRDPSRILPRIRALCPSAALLLLTTDDRPTLSHEVSRLDVADILVKPLHLDTLVERIRFALDSTASAGTRARIEMTPVGQSVRLITPEGECQTRILEANADSLIVVGAPRVVVPPSFAPGTRVQVEIPGKDAAYHFHSRLIREMDDPVPCWEIRLPRIIHRDQRRKYPRYPVQIAVRFAPESNLSTASLAEGRIEEVSLGGCALISASALTVGERITLDMRVSEAETMLLNGDIVRSEPLDKAGESGLPAQHRLAVAFRQMTPTDRLRLQNLLQHETTRR